MKYTSILLLLLFSTVSCLKTHGSGSLGINENVAPAPASAKALPSTIGLLPPKPKVAGDQLVTTNLVVQPIQVGTQQVLYLTVTPDTQADFLQLSICQDVATNPVCMPTPANPEVFIATEDYYPNPPIGKSTVQVRSCVQPSDAIDITKLCGAWVDAPYYMEKANPQDAWYTAIAQIHDGLQNYLVPCTALQNQVAAYLKAHPDVAAGTDSQSIMLQDSLNVGPFTCAQALQNGLLAQLNTDTSSDTDTGTDTGTGTDTDTGTGTGTDTGTGTGTGTTPPPVVTPPVVTPPPGVTNPTCSSPANPPTATTDNLGTIIISGGHFESGVTVKMSNAEISPPVACALTSQFSTSIACTPPPLPSSVTLPATVDITITNPDGGVCLATGAFTYNLPVSTGGGGSNSAELAGGITLIVVGAVLAVASYAYYKSLSKAPASVAPAEDTEPLQRLIIGYRDVMGPGVVTTYRDVIDAAAQALQLTTLEQAGTLRSALEAQLAATQAQWQQIVDDIALEQARVDKAPSLKPVETIFDEAVALKTNERDLLNNKISDAIAAFLDNEDVIEALKTSEYTKIAKQAIQGTSINKVVTDAEVKAWQIDQLRIRLEAILGIRPTPPPRLQTAEAKLFINDMMNNYIKTNLPLDELQPDFKSQLIARMDSSSTLDRDAITIYYTDDISPFINEVILGGLKADVGTSKIVTRIGNLYALTLQEAIANQVAADKLTAEIKTATPETITAEYTTALLKWQQETAVDEAAKAARQERIRQFLAAKERVETYQGRLEDSLTRVNGDIQRLSSLPQPMKQERVMEPGPDIVVNREPIFAPEDVAEREDPLPSTAASASGGKGKAIAGIAGAGIGVAMVLSGIIVSLHSQGLLLAAAAPDPDLVALQAAAQNAYYQALDIDLGIAQATTDLINLQLNQLNGQ